MPSPEQRTRSTGPSAVGVKSAPTVHVRPAVSVTSAPPLEGISKSDDASEKVTEPSPDEKFGSTASDRSVEPGLSTTDWIPTLSVALPAIPVKSSPMEGRLVHTGG